MVDMEEKVVSAVKQKRANWSYPSNSSLTEKRGSGNNWAAGYCGHGPRVERRAVELVRKQLEACDRLDGILAVMSLAGKLLFSLIIRDPWSGPEMTCNRITIV